MQRFKSRKDTWLRVTIWISNLALLILGMVPLLDEEVPALGSMIYLAIMWGVAFFLLWMWHSTAYMLSADHLVIRLGPFRKSIPYNSIRKVKRTTSHMSSAAQSSKRIEILYNRYDLVHISPVDEERFLSMLRERCPKASYEV